MAGISNMFGQMMVRLNEQTSRSAFEMRFQQMQTTILKRVNTDIEALNTEFTSSKRVREVEKLYKERASLVETYPKIVQYTSDNESNLTRLDRITDKIIELDAAFATDGNSTDVTATDITAFETLRAELYDQVNELRYLTLPGVVEPYAITHLKEELSAIEALTPAVGNTTDATNADITTYLGTLSAQVSYAYSATSTTKDMAYDLSLRYQTKVGEIDTAILEKDTAAKETLARDVENLKVGAANVLQAISISYETQASSASYLSNALNLNRPYAAGSIMNIFS